MYFIPCHDLDEARYLAAIINSENLYQNVQKLMSKGQYGPRDIHKHIWRLPIPTYVPTNSLHRDLVFLSEVAEQESAAIMAKEPLPRSGRTIRAKIRDWQLSSATAMEMEQVMNHLLTS